MAVSSPVTLWMRQCALILPAGGAAEERRRRDPAQQRDELAALQAICADPVWLRDYLLKSSMIEGLRQAEEIA